MTTRVCSLDDVAADSAIRVDVDGHRLAVVRCGDDVYVIGDRCTHADISLSEGEVDCETGTIECWKHGSTFRLGDGVPTVLPATRPTPTYEVTVTDGDVYVELGE
jgi:3-phenylpropionate/trans-cinnamate dioxygenase ferredoxin subunit